MKRILSIILFIVFLIVATILLYNQKQGQQITTGSGKTSVFASIYPLSYFVSEIGGDKVSVTTITPPGTEPHEYEPKPGDLAKIYKSNLLVINGINLEPWAEKIKSDLFVNGVSLVTASDGITLLSKGGQSDPHIWLDPVSAQRIVLNIRDGLVKVDPENEKYYRSNTDNLIVRLIDLDNLYRKSLFNCTQDTVIASHSVFGYLENRYKFKQDTLAGLSPDEEPSSQRIADLVSEIESKDIKIILTETLLSPKLSETLARETGATVQVFNPLESLTRDELNKHEDYFTIQDVNRNILISALQCTPI